ncbi:stage II sporulation protein E (SpoIIE) [Firmicutes bacterium CAG:631]|nr:stage II sporulation protein E (SpoIIE) [Firmicutes bacterium CAG:631]
MSRLCTDIGYHSLYKYGEELCGDHIEVVEQQENTSVIVLADGLGSGVKANILSTLTSKIISTMMANQLSIEECVSTIASTLPVCQVRKVAYSTFTIIRIVNYEYAEIYQYDNPHLIFIRDGQSMDYLESSLEIDGKTIYKSKIDLKENDTFVMFSDGVIHAGVGEHLNFGWLRENVIDFMNVIYDNAYSAKTLATLLTDKCNSLYGNHPGDDTTVCVVKIRQRQPMNLLIGPAKNPEDDEKMLSLFFSKEGKHIVCGGTTSTIVSRYLDKPVMMDSEYIDKDVPPTASIEGVDLVTEGVLTINKVLEYAKSYLNNNDKYYDWSYKRDGASMISRYLFEEATDIHFFVGRAMNPAHQNPELPINFNIKMHLIDELATCLQKMGKRVKVNYF